MCMVHLLSPYAKKLAWYTEGSATCGGVKLCNCIRAPPTFGGHLCTAGVRCIVQGCDTPDTPDTPKGTAGSATCGGVKDWRMCTAGATQMVWRQTTVNSKRAACGGTKVYCKDVVRCTCGPLMHRRGPQGTAGDRRGPQGTAGDRRCKGLAKLPNGVEVWRRFDVKLPHHLGAPPVFFSMHGTSKM